MKINFICAYGKERKEDLGIGHLYRLIYLAKEITLLNHEINFLIFGKNIENFNSKKDINVKKLKFLSFDSLLNKETIRDLNLQYDLTFVDLSNSFFLKNKFFFVKLLNKISRESKKTVLIDSLDKESIIQQSSRKFSYDLLISPYFGAEKEFIESENHLLGPEFFIFGSDYNKGINKKILKRANKILITCGGSDPKGLTSKIIKSLNKIENELNLKVVIGPNFSEKLIRNIDSLIIKSNHRVKKIISEDSLKKFISWSDITIATSGLTKYEILQTHTPSVIIPFNDKQYKLNRAAESQEAFITVKPTFTIQELASDIEMLLSNYKLRKKLSKKSSEIIDGDGIKKIITKLNLDD